MPLDTIGLYNKLEIARERAKNAAFSRERLFSKNSMTVVVSKNDIIPSVKGIFTESGNNLLFTLWTDPLDVELVTTKRPEPGAALIAAHDDDINDLNKIGISISAGKLSAARGYPKWRFAIVNSTSHESLMSSVNSLIINEDH